MLRAKQLPGPFDALTQLEVIATSLPGFSDASLPAAAARSGAVGLLNLTHHLDPHSAARTARELAQSGSPRVGLILRARLGEVEQAALAAIDAAELVLLVADPEVDLAAAVTDVRRHAKRVGVVVTSRDQARLAVSAGCDLLVAKGHESGGFVGEETSFVLGQGLAGAFELPLYVWGGISWNTAAACVAVGCAGVVVDWQLALLRESPLTDEVRRRIAQMDGSEIATQPCDQGQFLRFYHQPGLTARDRLAQLGTQSRTAAIDWQQHVARLTQELHPRDRLLLAGQDAAFAADWARHAASVGRALRRLEARVVQQVQAAAKAQILAPGSPLAASHGTHFPVVQGPMTRVSDVAGFCHDVARDGGLPFLALALMNETQVRSLLAETKAKLGSLPWGVGVLGFVPQEIRAQQWPAIREFRPPFAVIAGGRPDQAASLEAEGIATYLHVPSPGMLDMFLREGARRFVFEGRECGGHVGPRTSFVLWETMIRVLLAAELSDAEAAQVHVLFAGGIHDRLGAAMVAVLAQPLVDRGMKVGVLLGTAYLFTREIVASGALVEGFQSVAVSTKKTVVVESGPGHAIRCAETEFVDLFEREKRRLETSRISPEEQRIELEQLNLGRLRIAAKGVTRSAGDPGLTALDAVRQRAAGMYMIGQVASLRDRVCTIRELHEEVCQGGANLLSRATATEVLPPSRAI
ncbi:MAG: nitronate monooxygenase, partial [Planctomycetaceae bacterium]|nr:nitronate monooxygenase [Planctomycetaceae bacterium]